jgi:ribosomal protein S18 acetylase RimI-like enzyme
MPRLRHDSWPAATSAPAPRRIGATQQRALLPTLQAISDVAFAAPPWCYDRGDDHQLTALLHGPRTDVFVVEDGDVCGFAIGRVLCRMSLQMYGLANLADAAPGDYHLTWRAVRPDRQRQGFGTALIDCRVLHARRLGCRTVHAETDLLNLGTRRLLLSRGFVERLRVPRLRRATVTSRVMYVLPLAREVAS